MEFEGLLGQAFKAHYSGISARRRKRGREEEKGGGGGSRSSSSRRCRSSIETVNV